MDLLTRDAILTADDLKIDVVEVPEWGGAVRVRGLSGAERDAFEASVVDLSSNGRRAPVMNLVNLRAKLAARCIVDENGARLFEDADIVALGRKSAQALQRVFEAAQRLSGLTARDVEELEKNSAAGQPGALPSG